MRVTVEYDAGRWYVWTKNPWWKWLSMRKLICSGDTREQALELAKQRMAEGSIGHNEIVNL